MRCPAIFTALVLAASCGDAGDPGVPTFADDIAHVVYTSCTPCHRPGGPTPFSLLDYGDVYKRRRQIVEVTQDRLMPPWLPSHGDFQDDRRLRDEQIALLSAWVEAGAPRGDAAREPARPEFPDGWQLREPDLVLTVDEDVVVQPAGPDAFRNLVVPVAVDRVRFVEAVEIQPGNPAVHHAVMAVDPTREARRLDALDPEPGFPGMIVGNARPPDGYFLGWTPGKRVNPQPEGMAWRLAPGNDIVLQLHLTPTGKREVVRPRVGLYFTDTPPTAVSYPLVLFQDDIDIPAGATDHVLRDHFVVPVAVRVHSVYPHAHYLCRRMRATATLPNGSERDLFRIDRWDFDWQDDYRFREPVELPAGTRLSFEYGYDNSAGNPQNPFRPPRRVRFGQESTDEMATLTLQLTTADVAARRLLAEASIRRDLEKVGYDAHLLLQLTGLLREMGRNDEAERALARVREREPDNPDALRELGLCLLADGRVEDAERVLTECLRRDPNQNVARVELGSILARSGRTGPAIALFEKALEASPGLAPVHNNLATAYFAEGRLDRAERHYRRAVALDEGYFGAWFNLGRVLAGLGRKQEARVALLKARELRPGLPEVEQALRGL